MQKEDIVSLVARKMTCAFLRAQKEVYEVCLWRGQVLKAPFPVGYGNWTKIGRVR